MIKFKEGRTVSAIATNILLAAISLFFNGFGVYLTIQANIGAGPWSRVGEGFRSQKSCITIAGVWKNE